MDTCSNQLTVIEPRVSAVIEISDALPTLFGEPDSPAYLAWDDYFRGMIENDYTRLAYERATRRFFAWLPAHIQLKKITPGMIGRYLSDMAKYSIPTRKLHMAALRKFFDVLVQRHIMNVNPADSVRGPRQQVMEGRTPEITIEQARKVIASIRVQDQDAKGNLVPRVVGLRDRAIVGVMFYTGARAGAIAKLTMKNIRGDGVQQSLRFEEKGNKSREIPVRNDLWQWLSEYIDAAPVDDPTLPLFRTTIGKTRVLTRIAMSNIDICRMVKRRVADAGLPADISPHSFRVATITDLLKHGAPLEDVQYLAGHADPRTTRLYDRRQRRVTRNLVERISNLTDESYSELDA
ncbi:MAG TPA: tyrosine-type recombinase/integrase [Tepidisphaeraceae bacterium]|jgi:site-specific recombinase XerD|nr:tyrosine-type recombinase/integrase [Tepidisphaeraceae bacterium]